MSDVDAVRRARWATATIFLANGTIVGTWAAHIPLVEARLEISHATLGTALLFMAVGALIAMPITGSGIQRFGSAAIMRGALLCLFFTLPLPLIAPNPYLLAVALFLFGASNGIIDVAMNAHGVAVELRFKHAIMSSLHGMWSLGGLVGAGLAAALLPVLPGLAQAFAAIAIVALFGIAALFFLLPSATDGGAGGPAFAWPSRATIGLGALCFFAMMTEGAILDWSALHMKGRFAVSAGFAATGFAAFSAAMATGRFAGDWMRARFGSVALVRWSAFLATAGLVIALTVPWPLIAVGGFALVGFGIANMVPVFFGAAGRTPGQGTGTAIAALATMGYSGFLVGPPFIGLIADFSGLDRALILIVLACLAIGVFAGIVARADAEQ